MSAITDDENGGAGTDHKSADPWRVSGSYDLQPQQAAVLLELCRYREQVAKAIDRPLFKVINDKTLLAIAIEAPHSLRELGRLPGMSPVQIRRHGLPLLQAVQRGLKAEPIRPPRSPRPDERFLERLEALREWRKETAREMGVMSDVILPRDLLLAIAKRNPASTDELAKVLAEVPWRLAHFGDKIIEVLRGIR
jgi:ribonuclease D